jgi:cystathionine gamma-synthase
MLAAASSEDDGYSRPGHDADAIPTGCPTVSAMPSFDQPDPSTPREYAGEPAELDPGWSVDTAVVHLGRPPRSPGAPLNMPIEPASAYHAGGDLEYARDGTRASLALESAIGALEGGHCLAFSSGMAAASALLDTVPPGAIVVAPRHAYTGVSVRMRSLADQGRIELRTVDITDTAAVGKASRGAHLVWVESPTNPMLEIADIPAIATLAHNQGASVVCDNTFATPLGQQPLSHGADVVLHSATKMIGGHSDLLAGALVFADPEAAQRMLPQRTLLGGFPGALESFLALRGLRTLALRRTRAEHTAIQLAQLLREHPAIERVRYPGLENDPGFTLCQRTMSGPGTIIAIEPRGGVAAAEAISHRVRLWVHATSLGGVESLLERRRRWALESTLVPESLIRLSVGIEDPEDLWADLSAALDQP